MSLFKRREQPRDIPREDFVNVANWPMPEDDPPDEPVHPRRINDGGLYDWSQE